MTTQQERERALAEAIRQMKFHGDKCMCEREDRCPYCKERNAIVATLHDCVPVPRAELERMRRALWELMDTAYPGADEFAREMREKGGEGA